MFAEPVRAEDPDDPEVILRDLPERERAEFLRQYREAVEAVEAAQDPAGYRQLRRAPACVEADGLCDQPARLLRGTGGSAQRHRADEASRGSLPGLAAAAGGGAGPDTLTYRVDP